MKTILHLCSDTGSDSKPYKDAGYCVVLIGEKEDVRKLKPIPNVYGIIANPPCTHLAGSGARWWKEKGEQALYDGLALVDACCRQILFSRPKFWMLENPVGRLTNYLGPPRMYYQPWEYGDPYTKKTCLWGNFNIPKKNPCKPTVDSLAGHSKVERCFPSKMHLLPPSANRQKLRSIAPFGFVEAFYEANK